MTRVLVVTDNERVQDVFEDLQASGVLTLRTVSNLMQSDEQIAGFCPEFTFVQSRISGLSGDIILRHLKKLLPPEGKTVLLALGPEDAAQGRRQGARIVELSEARDGLAQEVTALLEGEPDRQGKRKAGGQADGSRRGRAAKKGVAAEVEATAGAPALVAGEGLTEQPAMATESRTEVEATAGEPASLVGESTFVQPPLPTEIRHEEGAEPAYPRDDSPETADDAPAAAEATGITPAPATFAEMMRQAEATALTGAVVEDKAASGALDHAPAFSEPMEARELEQGSQSETTGRSGGGGRGPKHRSKPRPLWTFPLILTVILLPLLYLLPSEKKGAQHPEPAAKGPAPQAARAPASVPPQTAAPVPSQAPAPAPRSSAEQVAPAKPAAAMPAAEQAPANLVLPRQAPVASQEPKQPGLRELPEFLRGVTLDHAYAKAHPGWQRYIGARAEYKLYREGGVYKALQVIALTGQTVPNEVLQKALREFGGIDSYQVQSTERKQHFLVDRGRAKGDIAVTVYRRINDRRVKGMVLYYMK